MLKRFSIVLSVTALAAAALWAQNPPVPRGGPQNPQQQLPPGTASISGSVVVLGTGQPIAGASLELRRIDCNNFSNPPEVVSTATGADGKFVVNNLHAGGWCIVATMPGGAFTPAEYLQRGVLGRGVTLPVVDGQKVTGIQLAMTPTSGITGRVLDYDGQPKAFARVQVMELFHQDGERRLYILQVSQTNDRGEYRFYWLPPGRYYIAAAPEDTRRRQVVSVQPPPGTGGHREDVLPPVVVPRISPRGELVEETYGIVYYPGETDPQHAIPIDVPPGSGVSGIDILLGAGKAPSFHIRGTVANSITGQAAEGAQLRVIPRDWTATVIMPGATVDAKGDFDISGVAPGAYVIYANQLIPNPAAAPPVPAANPAGPPAAATAGAAPAPPIPLTARLLVNVGRGNVDNVKLVLVQGVSISGKVVIEGVTGEIPRGISVSLARIADLAGAPSPQGRGQVQPDGTFTLQNVGPGDYSVYVTPFLTQFQWGVPNVPLQLQNGYVKSIRLGAADVLNDGLHVGEGASPGEIQITLGAGGKLGGSVSNERREPLANVTVALTPDLGSRRGSDLYRTATTDISGRFQIQGIPPGSYKAFAWEDVERDAWQNPDFIRPIQGRGITIDIREGAQANADLVAIPPARR